MNVVGVGRPGPALVAVKVVHTLAWSSIESCNGFRCPLTDVAESLGAEDGSVTDIYLPSWFAHHLPAIHVPLILLAAFLHGRNLRQRRSAIGR